MLINKKELKKKGKEILGLTFMAVGNTAMSIGLVSAFPMKFGMFSGKTRRFITKPIIK